MSKLKKASAILLVIAVFLSAFSIGAFAANNHDTGYSFTVGQGWQARTEYRKKQIIPLFMSKAYPALPLRTSMFLHRTGAFRILAKVLHQ